MIILDYQDRRPIYEQITERFRTLIYQGALPAGSRRHYSRHVFIRMPAAFEAADRGRAEC